LTSQLDSRLTWLLPWAYLECEEQEWPQALHVIGEIRTISQSIPYPYAELRAFLLSGQVAIALLETIPGVGLRHSLFQVVTSIH
jgi:hypothetical protein